MTGGQQRASAKDGRPQSWSSAPLGSPHPGPFPPAPVATAGVTKAAVRAEMYRLLIPLQPTTGRRSARVLRAHPPVSSAPASGWGQTREAPRDQPRNLVLPTLGETGAPEQGTEKRWPCLAAQVPPPHLGL